MVYSSSYSCILVQRLPVVLPCIPCTYREGVGVVWILFVIKGRIGGLGVVGFCVHGSVVFSSMSGFGIYPTRYEIRDELIVNSETAC